eukprot:scaffold2753_cov115-Isochrysis_galbana.AAC.2
MRLLTTVIRATSLAKRTPEFKPSSLSRRTRAPLSPLPLVHPPTPPTHSIPNPLPALAVPVGGRT